ncbi:hypothetical protein RA955_18340 [Geobacillus proteiniphilus]|uniref:Secreted protein n=1 Tax=Geobacillus proteiniphilus TaxID=860353 RepID=A0ABY9MET4_9BACL|nr:MULTISPECIES: hypothetical protein [Geobacillus]OPX02894.1 hypothetical protein B1A75_10775 [Geobacillus sp. LEMMY01]WMJ16533.1 hypothetical protein RA955_18340 [Geobacillus proteiniphilus]
MRNKAVMSAVAVGARLLPKAEAKSRSRRLYVGKLVMAVGSRQRLFSCGHRHGVEEAFSSFPASFALASWRSKWNVRLRFFGKVVWSGP